MIRDVARDVTHFQHPGGDTLSHYTDGQDATDAFETFHNRSHIAEARLRSLPEVELPRGQPLSLAIFASLEGAATADAEAEATYGQVWKDEVSGGDVWHS